MGDSKVCVRATALTHDYSEVHIMSDEKDMGNGIVLKGKDTIKKFKAVEEKFVKEYFEFKKEIESVCETYNAGNLPRNGGKLSKEVAVQLAIRLKKKSFHLLNKEDIDEVFDIRNNRIFC